LGRPILKQDRNERADGAPLCDRRTFQRDLYGGFYSDRQNGVFSHGTLKWSNRLKALLIPDVYNRCGPLTIGAKRSMITADDVTIEMARTIRELTRNVEAKLARCQLGLAFEGLEQ
jgi:hypothetical protein